MQGLKGQTVMVTGGCGFIGSHLVRGLVAAGVGRVVVLDNLRYGSTANLGAAASLPEVELVRFDLGSDPAAALGAHLRGVEVLFHLAAEKHNQSRSDTERLLRANVMGTASLFELAAREGVRRTVFSSSLYAYGRMLAPPFREDESARPATVYGISKLCGERLLDHFGRGGGMSGVTLRYLFVYGPRQFAGTGYKSVIVKNFDRLRAGAPPLVHGDGHQVLDYVYVDDVVEATLRAAVDGESGEIFNVGSGVGTSVNELTTTMLRVAGAGVEPLHDGPDETAGSARVGDVSKIRRALGWTPQVSLEEGLRRTWRWLAEEGA